MHPKADEQKRIIFKAKMDKYSEEGFKEFWAHGEELFKREDRRYNKPRYISYWLKFALSCQLFG
jgi:hypothetical protein